VVTSSDTLHDSDTKQCWR